MNKKEAKEICQLFLQLDAQRLDLNKQAREIEKQQKELRLKLEEYIGKRDLEPGAPKIDEIGAFVIEQKYNRREIPAQVSEFITLKIFEK